MAEAALTASAVEEAAGAVLLLPAFRAGGCGGGGAAPACDTLAGGGGGGVGALPAGLGGGGGGAGALAPDLAGGWSGAATPADLRGGGGGGGTPAADAVVLLVRFAGCAGDTSVAALALRPIASLLASNLPGVAAFAAASWLTGTSCTRTRRFEAARAASCSDSANAKPLSSAFNASGISPYTALQRQCATSAAM